MSYDAVIDATLRAVVRLPVKGPSRSARMNFEIDTGSQPELITSEAWASYLGLTATGGQVLMLADGTQRVASAAQIEVEWLDGPLVLDAIVLPSRQGVQAFAAPDRRRHGGQIDGLPGRQLLARGSHLEIDYVARSAKVRKSEPLAGGT